MGAAGATSKIAGPNSTAASDSVPSWSELVTKTYVWPAATVGIGALMLIPLIMPATLTTLRPLTKVRYEPEGMLDAAVNMAVDPGAGAGQVSERAGAEVAVGWW
jgi:hypothetical protein